MRDFLLSAISCLFVTLMDGGVLTGCRAAAGGPVGEMAVPFQCSAETLRGLSLNEQRVLIRAAIEDRLAKAENIAYQVDSFLFFGSPAADLPMQPPDDEEDRYSSFRQSFRWLDGDYHVSRIAFGSGGFSKNEPIGTIHVVYESGSSTGRILRDYVDEGQKFGRIEGVFKDSLVEEHRLSYWFSGRESEHGYFFLENLARNASEIQVQSIAEDHTVRIKVPWDPDRDGRVSGAYELTLDLAKGFLPIQVYGRWDYNSNWRTDEWVVVSAELVGDVWFPTKLQNRRCSAQSTSGAASIDHLEVGQVALGVVSRNQLHVEFPVGTFVVDAKKGESFTVGPDGKPTDRSLLVGASTVVASDFQEAQARNSIGGVRSYLVPINLIFAALMIAMFVSHRIVRSRQSDESRTAVPASPDARSGSPK